MTREELAAKVDWEGGLGEAVFGYGLDREDLPEDAPMYIRANWKVLMDAKSALRRVEEWLNGDTPGDSPDSPAAGEPGLPGRDPEPVTTETDGDYSYIDYPVIMFGAGGSVRVQSLSEWRKERGLADPF